MAKAAGTLTTYLQAIRDTLTAVLCVQNFASQRIERHNKPEVRKSFEAFLFMFYLVLDYNFVD